MRMKCLAIPAAVLSLFLLATAAMAQTPFYQGKTLKVLVGFPPVCSCTHRPLVITGSMDR